MKKSSFYILCCCFTITSWAGTADTVSIYSTAMKTSFNAVVIKPSNYAESKQAWPVVYLLHGYSGWYANWLLRVPALKDYADHYQLLIVCSEGQNSWYINNPVKKDSLFETYTATEVPAYIDAHYNTIKKRTGRAITGLSMGGHGGLFLGFRHADYFGACGSMSGGVDLKPFVKSWGINNWLDTTGTGFDWKNYTVMNVIENKPSELPEVIIDCGTEDFFYAVNKRLHEKMLQLNIPHDYTERTGKHDWHYWANAIKYQLLFFHEYFTRANSGAS